MAGEETAVPACKPLADEALRLLGYAWPDGGAQADEARAGRFYAMAPACLTQLQNEAARALGLPEPMPVRTLDGTPSLEAGEAWHILPAGLAMHFAMAARDDVAYSHYSRLFYTELLPGLAADEMLPRDAYGVRGDPTMR